MKKLLFLLLLSPLAFNIFAQENPDKAVFFELGGNGLLFSMNYERTIRDGKKSDINARIGIGGVPFRDRTLDVGWHMGYTIPTELSWVFGNKKGRLEMGMGYTFAKIHSSGNPRPLERSDDFEVEKRFLHILIPRVGYRYQSPESGFLFKISAITSILDGGIWGGIGIGKAF